MQNETESQWDPYLERFKNGEWRAPIFRDLILGDAKILEQQRGKLSILDIGCGGGFDSDARIQHSIAQIAGQYIGIEPDTDIKLENIYSDSYRCRFEDAPLSPDSVDIAFAVMVLEHFDNPNVFWDKIYHVLKKGGVFWGFTVDARHWFVLASLLTERLHVKDLYLNFLHGKRGEDRYENYGVYYRTNTPKQIHKFTASFSSRSVLNFHRLGQMDYYLPSKLKWFGRILDNIAMKLNLPGSVLAVRVEK